MATDTDIWGMSKMESTGHADSFVRDRLPPPEHWPVFLFDRPEYRYPVMLNAATRLLDDAVAEGHGDRVAIISRRGSWTYLELLETVDRIARVLVEDFGLVTGNRVLLHAPNTPMMAAAWLATLKAGGIAVATMPLLRSAELARLVEKAQISHALCDVRLIDAVTEAQAHCGSLQSVVTMVEGELEERMGHKTSGFQPAPTRAEDAALIAFTSGTTGEPKGCVHFHRDVMTMANGFSRHILRPSANDIFAGSPPLAFTFGLGGLLVFPLAVRAASVLDEASGPGGLLESVTRFGATTLFSAPTGYRAMLTELHAHRIGSLHSCVSAGEPMLKATSDAWRDATGIRPIDGLGSTEMIHIFLSSPLEALRTGATGKPVPGYIARLVDEQMQDVPVGETGRLAVRGPTGCRYLDDPRQSDYVIEGWNVTGDAYAVDEDGYFWFKSRVDDMIVSSGYNISGPEVESVLYAHPAVRECAVVGVPDEARGHIVKAVVVLAKGHAPSEDLVADMQAFVKQRIAPYKYPRIIAFADALPKTETGKIQRFKLRQASQQ